MREAGELLGVVGLGAVQLPAAIVLGVALGLPADGRSGGGRRRFGRPGCGGAGGGQGSFMGAACAESRPGELSRHSTPEAVGALRGAGVGVVGSLLVGVPVAAAVGVALGCPARDS